VRFVAPGRTAIEPIVFARPPLSLWAEFFDLLCGPEWPSVGALNERAAIACESVPGRDAGASGDIAGGMQPRFVVQSAELLRDGLHYEQRIADRNRIATRECNWHDLLNALVWLRFPALKSALNARQVAEIAVAGPKQRTLAQCALTHFDEAGVIVIVRDPALLVAWDAHDWHGLFWRERAAWWDGRIEAIVFGHALLEHALKAEQLLVGKAVAVAMRQSGETQDATWDGRSVPAAVAGAVRSSHLLLDPQELRPLPLSGIPGWHPANRVESFYRDAPCFRPLRSGRCYPAPLPPA
jgi:hypothetical protein